MHLRIGSSAVIGLMAVVGGTASAQAPTPASGPPTAGAPVSVTAPPPAEASPPPMNDDKGEASFFKVECLSKHIGRARIVVQRFRENNEAVARLLKEFSFIDPERGFPMSGRVEADLRADDCSIIKYHFFTEYTSKAGRVEARITCSRQEPVKPEAGKPDAGKPVPGKWTVRYEIRGASTEEKTLSSDAPLVAEEAIPLLLKPTLLQEGGTARFRILNPYSHLKTTLDLVVEVMPAETRQYAGRDVRIVPCVWVRSHSRPELKVETVKFTSCLTPAGELQEAQQTYLGCAVPVTLTRVATDGESYPQGKRLVKRNGRRDPFDVTRVLTPLKKDKPSGHDDGPGPKGPDSTGLEKRIDQLKKIVAEAELIAQKEGAEGQTKLLGKNREFVEILVASGLQQAEGMTPEQRGEVEGLRGRMSRLVQTPTAIIELARKMVEHARKGIDAQRQLLQAQQRFGPILDELNKVKGMEKDMEATAAAGDFQSEVLPAVKQLEARVKALQDFQKIKLEVTGIVYHLVEAPIPVDVGARLLGQDMRVTGTMPLFVSRSGAIINGTPLVEGDVLNEKGVHTPGYDPQKGVGVARIRTDDVIFRFHGEEIAIPLTGDVGGARTSPKGQTGN